MSCFGESELLNVRFDYTRSDVNLKKKVRSVIVLQMTLNMHDILQLFILTANNRKHSPGIAATTMVSAFESESQTMITVGQSRTHA